MAQDSPPRSRYLKVVLKMLDAPEGKLPGSYESNTLSETTITLPVQGAGALLLGPIDELARVVRDTVEAAERVYPRVEPQPEEQPDELAELRARLESLERARSSRSRPVLLDDDRDVPGF